MGSHRAYYDAPLSEFLSASIDSVIGIIAQLHTQQLDFAQTAAWKSEISDLKQWLSGETDGHIFLEFSIPRMGKRADVVLIAHGIVFVIEFKVGSDAFHSADRRQTEGYALDLKNFHLGSHDAVIVPVLIATGASSASIVLRSNDDLVYDVINSNGKNLMQILVSVSLDNPGRQLDAKEWAASPYRPTPTIIEAAQALYADHSVDEIARNDAGAKNLAETSTRLQEIIHDARLGGRKAICFVTGVPGSGKTLVGLNLATSRDDEEQAVFLSGNGPLVEVLREALARDEADRTSGMNREAARRKVRSFIQNVHHFRDEALQTDGPPHEHVVVFDEAQRAWDRENTSRFMRTKRGQMDFDKSEPSFLLEYMDRHQDWCVVIALIGGGQEINTGEAGLVEWRDAVSKTFPNWDVHYSDRINTDEYAGTKDLFTSISNHASPEPRLHLATSMRSFRAERLSAFVHYLVNGESQRARHELEGIRATYPIALTRDLEVARDWLRAHARGTDAIGIVAASKALRLKPHGIFVKNDPDIVNWFLNPPEDIRSSHMLEDVATEFDIQGLELDWVAVGWDADFSMMNGQFVHRTFRGTRWQNLNTDSDKRYLQNAYRVLLTRARQGMVIFVPKGSETDATRHPSWYDGTYEYLKKCGIEELDVD